MKLELPSNLIFYWRQVDAECCGKQI